MSCSQIAFPRAVLFDMDGTLTEPTFDFPGLRKQLGLPAGAPILEGIEALEPGPRERATLVMAEYEDEMAATASLAEGCEQLLHYLMGRKVPLAVITRNRRASVATFLKRHPLPIEVWITREDAPHKPDPASLLQACQRLGVAASGAWMIGDGLYDVEAGINAGMATIWLAHGRTRDFAATPWKTVQRLCDVLKVCQDCDKKGE